MLPFATPTHGVKPILVSGTPSPDIDKNQVCLFYFNAPDPFIGVGYA